MTYSKKLTELRNTHKLSTGTKITHADMLGIIKTGYGLLPAEESYSVKIPPLSTLKAWLINPDKKSHKSCDKKTYEVFKAGFNVWKKNAKIIGLNIGVKAQTKKTP